MNIKSERAHRMAKRLARQTGTTVTAAVEVALEEKLARLERSMDVEAKFQRIKRFVDALPAPPPGLTSDHSDLYDDRGLPI
nr:type II toxin-antitoxin system VapB family antitoxin [Nitratireductor mangrovi]